MTLEELQERAEKHREEAAQFTHEIKVCVDSGCLAGRSDKLADALEEAAKAHGGCTRVRRVGCLGPCAQGPIVSVMPENKTYQQVQEKDAPAIFASMQDAAQAKALELPTDTPFFTEQVRICRENAGHVEPELISDYLGVGGYQTLVTVLNTMTPAQVIEQVTISGLRGRGGAGFPTGLKWSTVSKAQGPRKYVICNGDEGDPGAFMDRSAMEGDPHRLLEGMAIAAYAVGADTGFLYVRAEYPLAVKRLRSAIKAAEKLGVLGSRIAGTNFSFNVDVRLGAGAFVCGEETALIASIEGKRGTPRPRPPFPAERGLWGCPTLINNVETFGSIVPILRDGGAQFASLGTEKSKGTKVFSLTGRIRNTGLIEVPMGMPLRKIIYDIGGGIPEGKKFKAVQTGGPSGGCIPEEFLDMPVDYESLAKVGSIMGSGGMIVMDETSCMVDVARFFMDFCKSESCGKCIPCRTGTAQMHGLLTKITEGEATEEDLALLEEICEVTKFTSLCGLGQTSPNPVMSTLRYFRDEYLAHIREKRCPAGVCKMKASSPSLANGYERNGAH